MADILELAANEFLYHPDYVTGVGYMYSCAAVSFASRKYHKDDQGAANDDIHLILKGMADMGMRRYSLVEFDQIGTVVTKQTKVWPHPPLTKVKLRKPGKFDEQRPTGPEKQEWRYAWLMFAAMIAREQAAEL
jgi:hypothetical protein